MEVRVLSSASPRCRSRTSRKRNTAWPTPICACLTRSPKRASRKAEQELATAIEAAKVAQAAIRTAAREWMRVRIARIRQHRPPMQEMLASDFEDSLRELERAKANIWPGQSEIRWQEFRAREASEAKPQKLTNAEVRKRFEMV